MVITKTMPFMFLYLAAMILCVEDERSLLLELRSSLSFDSSSSTKLVTWNTELSADCCRWEGVRCDEAGHVVSLSLDGEAISDGIKGSSTLFRLRYLEELSLANNKLVKEREIPMEIQNLKYLTSLDLSGAGFCGAIPEALSELRELRSLYLSRNFLSGSVPDSLFLIRRMERLLVSDNLLTGGLRLKYIELLPQLKEIDFSNNNLSIDASHMDTFRSSKLLVLRLGGCNLSHIPSFIEHLSLSELDLSNNHIAGEIPSWIWRAGFGANSVFNLSNNLFSGLQELHYIPAMKSLDLHSNQLRGVLPPLPPNALYVDYSGNNFGELPPDFFDSYSIAFLSLADNNIRGAIPISICNATALEVLDLSHNNLGGNIPRCLLHQSRLQVLNLKGNRLLGGSISGDFPTKCSLRILDVSSNNLSGRIPTSLANCRALEVLNVGDNSLDDDFPCMLWYLQVVVLRSNNFHGELTCDQTWPNLQVLDVSNNGFSGNLSGVNFTQWRRMMVDAKSEVRQRLAASASDSYYDHYRLTLAIKGRMLELVGLSPDFTTVDLSRNIFDGEIPDEIGELRGLRLLNLSQNALSGSIPQSIGQLSNLESLDLSMNQVTGMIPVELGRLNYLSYLNLSDNKLVGKIPDESLLFQTFTEASFHGNPDLCGSPTQITCVDLHKLHNHGSYQWSNAVWIGVAFLGMIFLVVFVIVLVVLVLIWRNIYG